MVQLFLVLGVRHEVFEERNQEPQNILIASQLLGSYELIM